MNIQTYYDSHENFRYSIIDVGSGLMILCIFPNSDVLLFDCNVTVENSENILNYLEDIIPSRWDVDANSYSQWIDIFVNSHRDLDHIRGLKTIADQFRIKEIWDSGQSGVTTDSKDYEYYMGLRRTLRRKYGDDAVKIPIPSLHPIYKYSNFNVNCLNSTLDFSQTETFYTSAFLKTQLEEGIIDEEKVKEQHTNSLVLSIEYNKFRMLICGDSDWFAWKENIVPNFKNSVLLDSDILIASHHGSRSFFTSEDNEHIDIEENPDSTYLDALNYIKPHMTLISCGDYSEYHHPNKEALVLYRSHSSHDQVYTTNNRGTFEGLAIDKNNWAVIPCMFETTNPKKFEILAKVNGNYITNGASLSKYSLINFSLKSLEHGFLEPSDSLHIKWNVCNSSKDLDISHHEIYDNNIEENNKPFYSKYLEYSGQHLLRCYVYNPIKRKRATYIFKVQSNF